MFSFSRLAAFAILLLGLVPTETYATDLRGLINRDYRGVIAPGVGVTVKLAVNRAGTLVVLQETATNQQGFYFFRGVNPGGYVLLVDRLQFPIFVASSPVQDIPPINAP